MDVCNHKDCDTPDCYCILKLAVFIQRFFACADLMHSCVDKVLLALTCLRENFVDGLVTALFLLPTKKTNVSESRRQYC